MQFDDAGFAYIEPGDDFRACASRILALGGPEFAIFPYISADSVEAAALAGFMPMGIRIPSPIGDSDYLLAKLHMERCLLDPRSVKVTRTARRESRHFMLSVNRAFRDVLAACVLVHGDEWLVPDLVSVMSILHKERARRRASYMSVELWEACDYGPSLVAGEIGYAIGGSYASLTGFTSVSGAGTVQLAALGRLLAATGMRVWDLGMDIAYKQNLGARPIPRKDYLALLAAAYAKTSLRTNKFKQKPSRLLPARSLLEG